MVRGKTCKTRTAGSLHEDSARWHVDEATSRQGTLPGLPLTGKSGSEAQGDAVDRKPVATKGYGAHSF